MLEREFHTVRHDPYRGDIVATIKVAKHADDNFTVGFIMYDYWDNQSYSEIVLSRGQAISLMQFIANCYYVHEGTVLEEGQEIKKIEK